MSGLTLVLVFGRYGGFHMSSGHICLGWMSFSILGSDLELVFDRLIRNEAHLKDKVDELEGYIAQEEARR